MAEIWLVYHESHDDAHHDNFFCNVIAVASSRDMAATLARQHFLRRTAQMPDPNAWSFGTWTKSLIYHPAHVEVAEVLFDRGYIQLPDRQYRLHPVPLDQLRA